jgi:hypothetical protein
MRGSGGSRTSLSIAIVAVLLFFGARPAAAEVPASLQAAILVKMLAYDRALKARAGESVGIGILYKDGDDASARMKEELLRAFAAVSSRPIQGLPVQTGDHAYRDAEHLTKWLASSGIDLVYVTTGLSKEREAIRKACLEARVLTAGVERPEVEAGLAVAVVTKGEAPHIVVNIAAAHAVGADLDPKLLALSDVVK